MDMLCSIEILTLLRRGPVLADGGPVGRWNPVFRLSL